MPPAVHTLSNGVRVVCDPMPGLQTVALSVVAGRGARAEDEAQSGWSHLLEHMVFKGAGGRSAREIVVATPRSLGDWRAALYGPQSLVVSAAGAVDEAELVALAERDFGQAAVAPPPHPAPAGFAGGLRPLAKRLEQANLVLLLPAVGARDPAY